ncbi:hypothetical protein [Streptomyces ficellus]|uniref:Integral membrane protein n=1 Tax=Streptomyces ficellus TaxID=1977088 RepID=A0A6I6FMG5_9ACTN|nr:hypothetical protein [Streptomyces ficellus]QGV80229.1 hypothetical protein EIZ62_19795 [Streptomyces ficellus]
MHGHGHAPPQPGRTADGTLVVLRTLFVALTVLSCGFLAWTPLLRLAVVTRRALDWILFCVVTLSAIGMFAFLVAATPTDENQEISDGAAIAFLTWTVITILGVTVYYLIAEIRHYGSATAGPAPLYGAPRPTGYGYPPAAPPQQTRPQHTQPHQPPHHQTQPQHPTPPPQPPHQPQQAPHQPHQTPPPAPKPTPQRIDQVRAELDELSDLLRSEPRDRDPRDEGR